MARKFLLGLLLLSAVALVANPAAAAEPSLHQIYQTAEAGKLNEAQSMMQDVLKAHPNSGKAHYVEAELLAKQGQFGKAEAELATAERLAPGLPFAQPQAVQDLKKQLGKGQAARPAEIQPARPLPAAGRESAAGFPWSLLLIGGALIAFIFWVVGFMKQRNATPANSNYIPRDSNGFGNANPAPYGMPPQPYNTGGFGMSNGLAGAPGQTQGQGIGSRIMGGLATGAAVGAGVVAGEALMHHFMDGDKEKKAANGLADLGPSDTDSSGNDFGGNDFGIADSGSWDDSSDSNNDWS
jgi:uncharacterized protein